MPRADQRLAAGPLRALRGDRAQLAERAGRQALGLELAVAVDFEDDPFEFRRRRAVGRLDLAAHLDPDRRGAGPRQLRGRDRPFEDDDQVALEDADGLAGRGQHQGADRDHRHHRREGGPLSADHPHRLANERIGADVLGGVVDALLGHRAFAVDDDRRGAFRFVRSRWRCRSRCRCTGRSVPTPVPRLRTPCVEQSFSGLGRYPPLAAQASRAFVTACRTARSRTSRSRRRGSASCRRGRPPRGR